MGLTREAIEKVLTESGIEFQWTMDGPLLPAGWCLRSCSGISGRVDVWFAWHLPTNTTVPDNVASKAALYRLLCKIEGGGLSRMKLEIRPEWLPLPSTTPRTKP
jgi:hypothetical protein